MNSGNNFTGNYYYEGTVLNPPCFDIPLNLTCDYFYSNYSAPVLESSSQISSSSIFPLGGFVSFFLSLFFLVFYFKKNYIFRKV
ncbi:MAG: hypothetical protein KC550_04845 [Nanoarchaeota archaeon]|nr:hypothetical protein [Nanoarchaeota archaeon]